MLTPMEKIPVDELGEDHQVEQKEIKKRQIIRRRKKSRRTTTMPSKLKNYCINGAVTNLRKKLNVENQSSSEILINPLTNRPIRRSQLYPKVEVKPEPEKKKPGRPKTTSTKKMKRKYSYNSYEEYQRPRRSYPGQKIPCPLPSCDRVFLYRLSLLRHLAYECQILPPFKCGLCELRTHYISSIRNHTKKVHQGQEPMVMELRNDKFVEIEKDYDQKYNLNYLKELIALRKPELLKCKNICDYFVRGNRK